MQGNRFHLFSGARRLFVIIALMALGVVLAAPTPLIPKSRAVLATATPSLSVQGYLAPGDTVRVNGGQFIPGETVTLSYDATAFATVVVRQRMGITGSQLGTFSASFTVPTSTTTGSHTFSAVAQPSGLTAQSAVTVNANWAQYGFTPTNTRLNPYETAINATNVSQLTVAWTFTATNVGMFSYNIPSVHDGSIYFSTIANNTTYRRNASTGALIWSVVSDNFPAGPQAPAISSSAISTVYTTGYYLNAFWASSGAMRWGTTTTYTVDDAPTLANGFVYVTTGGSLAAFHADGCGQWWCTAAWQYTDSLGSIVGTPAVANGLVYVGTTTGKLIVVDASTGVLQWVGTIATGDQFGPGAPVVDNGMVFIATGGLYASNSTLYAFPAAGCGSATCAPTWSAAVSQQFGIGAAVNLAVANGTIFVSSTDWHLYAFSESGCGSATCAPIWAGQTAGKIESAPAVANGVVYVGSYDDGAINAFNASGCGAATCAPIWTHTLGENVQGGPIVVNGMVYITSRHSLYAFHLPAASMAGRACHRGQSKHSLRAC